MNTADIFIFAVIAFMALLGFYKGLIRMLFGLLGFVIAAVAAKMYYPQVSVYISENTGIFEKIRSGVFNRLEEYAAANPGMLQGGGLTGESPSVGMGFPKTIEEMILNSEVIKDHAGEAIVDVVSRFAEAFARLAVDALSILLIFIVVKIAVALIAWILDKLFSLPVVRTFKNAGGLLIGLVEGLLVIYLLAILMIPVASAFPESYIVTQMQSSKFAVLFFENNLLLQTVYTFILN
ncbi:MAG: CvpA family protein [Peptostreptococcaceae bacterium]|nr:CvpA family protein [Peptostreptococcaceae bacterium]